MSYRCLMHGGLPLQLLVAQVLCIFLGALAHSIKHDTILVLLDVDNTLYEESSVQLEHQIVQNIHKLIDPRIADELHATYGSTIAGLDTTLWSQLDDRSSRHKDYYDSVYRKLNYRNLLPEAPITQDFKTGYSYQQTHQLRRLLKSMTKTNARLHIASNSPRHHVDSVLQAMGMARVPWSGITTPNADNGFATKLDGPAFLGKNQHGQHVGTTVLIDDSLRNLQSFSNVTTFHCNNMDPHANVNMALGKALGWIDPEFVFSDVSYLEAKNRVDRDSIHLATWERVRMELKGMARLNIVDLGAGLLSMLHLGLYGSDRLSPLWTNETTVDYFAYEPNSNLESPIIGKLDAWGFRRIDAETKSSTVEKVFRKGRCTVHVCFKSFEDTSAPKPTPDLIVGCCFADLHDPEQLVPSIVAQFLSDRHSDASNSTLLYFPITFRGTTHFLPPQPFEGRVPSDTLAFQLYSEALQDMGHHLDPRELQAAVEDYGGKLLGQGPSSWNIEQGGIFWQTMLYFFGSAGASKFTAASWDIGRWLQRARRLRPAIQAANVDLLFRLPLLGRWSFDESTHTLDESNEAPLYHEILFTAPRQVSIVQKQTRRLNADELRIRAECSLISTGTELKVFTGQFDDAPLDVSIESMKDERLHYPLAYGYSLVGTVVECGSDIDRHEWIGRRVFCFNPHASQAICKACNAQLVPEDCSSLDAIFMPSVETALSLVQEARPVLGENVGVFGQGLIGLLVTLLLRHFQLEGSHSFGVVTTFDAIADRLLQSSMMKSSQALLPNTECKEMFDVSIEVSGNIKALQAAIDATKPGGRILIGSWYGRSEVPLRLGMDFHRSHKTLVASQVSHIAPSLSGTWDKDRRFLLAWFLVKTLQPSRLISKQVRLCDVFDAYTSLEAGKDVAIAITY